MENEEKKGCCEGKGNCEHGMTSCCHNWRRCHTMKWIIMFIVIIIAFCLGTQWGEMRGEFRGGDRFERGGMMDWGYGRFNNDQTRALEKTSGSVTVQVDKVTPVAPKPAQ